jgi:L-amino acid N-acyltransferase YncA
VGVALIAVRRLRRVFVAEEAHVWLALELGNERPMPSLPGDFVLRRACDADLDSVERLPGAEAAEVIRPQLGTAHELWIVSAGERVAFVCWMHRDEAPVFAAQGGTLSLPAGVCCLEDSVTAPEFRGRGVAPGAWASIASAMKADGYTAIITKVEAGNHPSVRALEKVGFAEIATMHLVRRWPNTRVTLSAVRGEIGRELARRLSR